MALAATTWDWTCTITMVAAGAVCISIIYKQLRGNHYSDHWKRWDR